MVQKVTEPSPDPSSAAFGFSVAAPLSPTVFTLQDGETQIFTDLVSGTYSVSETMPTDWELVTAICDDGSDPAAITLDPGETVICIFTNRVGLGVRLLQRLVDLISGFLEFAATRSSRTSLH